MLADRVGPSHAFVHVVSFGGQINVCGMTVMDGDLIHADQHGAVVIPHDVADKVMDAAAWHCAARGRHHRRREAARVQHREIARGAGQVGRDSLTRPTTIMPSVLPAFSLADMAGEDWAFPTGAPSLVCFVKEDCPTCNLVMPLLQSARRCRRCGAACGGTDRRWQPHAHREPRARHAAARRLDAQGVVRLRRRDGAPGAAGERRRRRRSTGWSALTETSGRRSSRAIFPMPKVDWDALPKWRPGCGSLTQDPVIAERLRAESENSPLRARKIEIAPADDVHEFLFDQGFTDGLPVVPPTPERVLRMLGGTGRDSQEVIAEIPPNYAPATVEKIAINAVLAGCKPEYMPVVIATIEAICNKTFNIHGVNATTMGASPGDDRERSHPRTPGHEHGPGRARPGVPRQCRHRPGGAACGAQYRWRQTRRHRTFHPRQSHEVHDVLPRVGGTQPLGTTARGAGLQGGRLRGDGVRDVERSDIVRRPVVAHRTAACGELRAVAGSRAPRPRPQRGRCVAGDLAGTRRHPEARWVHQGRYPRADPEGDGKAAGRTWLPPTTPAAGCPRSGSPRCRRSVATGQCRSSPPRTTSTSSWRARRPASSPASSTAGPVARSARCQYPVRSRPTNRLVRLNSNLSYRSEIP